MFSNNDHTANDIEKHFLIIIYIGITKVGKYIVLYISYIGTVIVL